WTEEFLGGLVYKYTDLLTSYPTPLDVKVVIRTENVNPDGTPAPGSIHPMSSMSYPIHDTGGDLYVIGDSTLGGRIDGGGPIPALGGGHRYTYILDDGYAVGGYSSGGGETDYLGEGLITGSMNIRDRAGNFTGWNALGHLFRIGEIPQVAQIFVRTSRGEAILVTGDRLEEDIYKTEDLAGCPPEDQHTPTDRELPYILGQYLDETPQPFSDFNLFDELKVSFNEFVKYGDPNWKVGALVGGEITGNTYFNFDPATEYKDQSFKPIGIVDVAASAGDPDQRIALRVRFNRNLDASLNRYREASVILENGQSVNVPLEPRFDPTDPEPKYFYEGLVNFDNNVIGSGVARVLVKGQLEDVSLPFGTGEGYFFIDMEEPAVEMALFRKENSSWVAVEPDESLLKETDPETGLSDPIALKLAVTVRHANPDGSGLEMAPLIELNFTDVMERRILLRSYRRWQYNYSGYEEPDQGESVQVEGSDTGKIFLVSWKEDGGDVSYSYEAKETDDGDTWTYIYEFELPGDVGDGYVGAVADAVDNAGNTSGEIDEPELLRIGEIPKVVEMVLFDELEWDSQTEQYINSEGIAVYDLLNPVDRKPFGNDQFDNTYKAYDNYQFPDDHPDESDVTEQWVRSIRVGEMVFVGMRVNRRLKDTLVTLNIYDEDIGVPLSSQPLVVELHPATREELEAAAIAEGMFSSFLTGGLDDSFIDIDPQDGTPEYRYFSYFELPYTLIDGLDVTDAAGKFQVSGHVTYDDLGMESDLKYSQSQGTFYMDSTKPWPKGMVSLQLDDISTKYSVVGNYLVTEGRTPIEPGNDPYPEKQVTFDVMIMVDGTNPDLNFLNGTKSPLSMFDPGINYFPLNVEYTSMDVKQSGRVNGTRRLEDGKGGQIELVDIYAYPNEIKRDLESYIDLDETSTWPSGVPKNLTAGQYAFHYRITLPRDATDGQVSAWMVLNDDADNGPVTIGGLLFYLVEQPLFAYVRLHDEAFREYLADERIDDLEVVNSTKIYDSSDREIWNAGPPPSKFDDGVDNFPDPWKTKIAQRPGPGEDPVLIGAERLYHNLDPRDKDRDGLPAGPFENCPDPLYVDINFDGTIGYLDGNDHTMPNSSFRTVKGGEIIARFKTNKPLFTGTVTSEDGYFPRLFCVDLNGETVEAFVTEAWDFVGPGLDYVQVTNNAAGETMEVGEHVAGKYTYTARIDM
ncbi:MAG: hypothetical protein QGH40_02980, partial [bacterium]|nr:hypothetical protein [bacterium]